MVKREGKVGCYSVLLHSGGILGGLDGITPNFNQLVHEGILFSNIYSSGDRTDQGVIAIISGFPSQPTSAIGKFPFKTQNLPFISKDFKDMGYHTAWTYGYNINYANFNSYLNLAGFEEITEKNDFGVRDYINSKWGVDDHKVFNRLLEQINNYDLDKPFFWVGLTLSSHEPFKVPMETVIEGDDNESLFLNSAYYLFHPTSKSGFLERNFKSLVSTLWAANDIMKCEFFSKTWP